MSHDDDLMRTARLQESLGFPPYILAQEAAASVRLDRDQTHVVGTPHCGSWPEYGGCILPQAHNMGRLDIPENHQFKKETPVELFETRPDGVEDWQGELETAAAFLLSNAAGLDITNPHGASTPARFVRMLKELTTPEAFTFTTFPADSQNMIQLKGIPFASVCSHHVIPFVGYAHIAYVPNEEIAGLSKFARLVKAKSRSLQVQESLTAQIADAIEEILAPKGVAVIMEAEHLCMTIRGAQAPGTMTRTAEMRGVFADHDRTAKAEFLSYINSGA